MKLLEDKVGENLDVFVFDNDHLVTRKAQPQMKKYILDFIEIKTPLKKARLRA